MTPTPAPVTVSLESPASPLRQPQIQLQTGPRGEPAPRRRGGRRRLGAGLRLTTMAAVLAALLLFAGRLGSAVERARLPATVAAADAVAALHTAVDAEAAEPPSQMAVPAATVEAAPPRPQVVIDNGVTYLPLEPAVDGAYDLIVHFHGHAAAVEQSVQYAGIDAVLAVVNLGVGAGVYRKHYQARGSYEALLTEIDRVVSEHAGAPGKVRRVALSAFSAGYGAVASILEHREGQDPLDAILIIDGIYSTWLDPARTEIDPEPLAVFAVAARAAAAGELLFSLSHSMIEPYDSVGPGRTSRYLLVGAGGRVEPQAMLPKPARVQLQAQELLVSAEHRLLPTHDSRIGELRVRGYEGTESEDHSAQLLQMAATVLPDLAERWTQR